MPSDTVIKVENLSKQYRIGEHQGYKTFREAIVDAAKAPVNALRSVLRSPGLKGSKLSSTDDTIWALKDVSFEVKRGEVVGIIGRNGAGKSTLLKILSKITEPTSGRIEMKGRVGSLLEVGTGFHPELTGHENVYMYGAILGMDRWEVTRKFDEIVSFAELEKFIDTPVKRYSSGMYMRLAFAVAAHMETEILLVDEVLAVGDSAFQKKCLGKMGAVAKEGRTVLFVSHNMAAIQNLCQRAILLSSGIIEADETAQQAIDMYLGSIQNNGALALSARTDRQGRGEILITKIDLLGEDYQPINNAMSGREVIIRLYYATNKKDVFRNCRMSVSIHINGTAYVLLSSELVTNDELVLTGDGFVDCIIPGLPLSRGEYYLSSFIEANKTIQDWVEGAAVLSVIDGDFYGTGRNYPPGWEGQTILVKHHWKW